MLDKPEKERKTINCLLSLVFSIRISPHFPHNFHIFPTISPIFPIFPRISHISLTNPHNFPYFPHNFPHFPTISPEFSPIFPSIDEDIPSNQEMHFFRAEKFSEEGIFFISNWVAEAIVMALLVNWHIFNVIVCQSRRNCRYPCQNTLWISFNLILFWISHFMRILMTSL